MDADNGGVLPYRTSGEDLVKLVKHRARGRSMDQVRTMNFSRKGFEGTVRAATALGLVTEEEEDLTDRGRKFALASSGGERQELLLEAILSYEPYELLLDAAFSRNEEATPLEWIETWWSTGGYGNSANNRSEGSTAFARLVDSTSLGDYVQGRRGHPTRIEWVDGAKDRVEEIRRHLLDEQPQQQDKKEESKVEDEPPSAVETRDRSHEPVSAATPDPRESGGGDEDTVRLSLPLGDERKVEMTLPAVVTEDERDRILSLVRHLVQVEESETE